MKMMTRLVLWAHVFACSQALRVPHETRRQSISTPRGPRGRQEDVDGPRRERLLQMEQNCAMMGTCAPTGSPSAYPTDSPTTSPSSQPSGAPTTSPAPSQRPSMSPSESPSISMEPTDSPQPSSEPTSSPQPSLAPTKSPSSSPSARPSARPSPSPSAAPSSFPTVSFKPSSSPSVAPTDVPSTTPTVSLMPSETPSDVPSRAPSSSPSDVPSASPSQSSSPSAVPTTSAAPTTTLSPSLDPSGFNTIRFTGMDGVEQSISTCRSPIPAEGSASSFDQIIGFSYTMNLDPSTTSLEDAIHDMEIVTQQELAEIYLTSNCSFIPGGDFYVHSITSYPVDVVSDITCASDVSGTECFVIDAAVTASIFYLVDGRRLEPVDSIQDRNIRDSFSAALADIFGSDAVNQPGVESVEYAGISNGAVPRGGDDNDGGKIAGAVIGTVAVCLLVVLLAMLFLKGRRRGGGGNTRSTYRSSRQVEDDDYEIPPPPPERYDMEGVKEDSIDPLDELIKDTTQVYILNDDEETAVSGLPDQARRQAEIDDDSTMTPNAPQFVVPDADLTDQFLKSRSRSNKKSSPSSVSTPASRGGRQYDDTVDL